MTAPDEHLDADSWSTLSSWWQEEFTEGADPEYTDQIVPLCVEHLRGAERVLDLGAGEGQISRALMAAGAARTVVALDPTWAQIGEAAARGGGPLPVQGDTRLPLRDGSCDAVVACLVFEHVDDHVGAIAEVARVLRPGGRFLLLLNHPLLQTPSSGWIDDHVLDPPEQYWRIGPYLPVADTVDEVAPGVHVRFVHRPLSHYVNTLADHGLHVVEMLEPPPPERFLARNPDYAAARDIPRLLALDTRRGVVGGR